MKARLFTYHPGINIFDPPNGSSSSNLLYIRLLPTTDIVQPRRNDIVSHKSEPTFIDFGLYVDMSLKLKVGRGFRSASVGDRDSTSPSIRAQPITSRTTVSPSDTNSSKASGQQKKESDQGGCQYNNFSK